MKNYFKSAVKKMNRTDKIPPSYEEKFIWNEAIKAVLSIGHQHWRNTNFYKEIEKLKED